MQSEQGIGNNLPLQAVVWTVLLLNLLHFFGKQQYKCAVVQKDLQNNSSSREKGKKKEGWKQNLNSCSIFRKVWTSANPSEALSSDLL